MGDDPDDAAPDDQRLSRQGGHKGLSLGERLNHAFHRLQFASPLHRMRLKGRYPLKLIAVPQDPILGDAAGGGVLARDGLLRHAGHSVPMRDFLPAMATAPAAWRDWAHGFGMLRDLAAAIDRVGGAKIAEKLTRAWIEAYAEFDAVAWRPDLLGTRLMMWCAYAPYILAGNELVHRSHILNHLARGARHLERAHDKVAEGLPRLRALGGLLTAGLLLPGGEARTARTEQLFDKALETTLLPDGGVVSRTPLDALELLELLLLVEAVYAARAIRPPEWLAAAINRSVSGLKALQTGDGLLTAVHGNAAGQGQRTERAIARSGTMERAVRNGRFSGMQRLSAGRTVLIVDAGPPPIARVSSTAHAGTLAFEMSDGPARIIVNCGGTQGLAKPLPAALATVLRMTAAHSTLILDDVNSTRIRDDGTLGRGVEEVVVSRQESEEGVWLEASHDGYARRAGLLHARRLYLAADGSDLRGEDALEPAKGSRSRKAAGARFDLRFHLAAGVEATATADSLGALLQLPSGGLWQFRARGGTLAIDESLVIDPDGHVVRTQQLVVSGTATAEGASINWSLKRAK